MLFNENFTTTEALEELKMAFKSLGERLGFVSAGDVRRAREKQIRIESEKRGEIRGEIIGRKAERQKANDEFLKKTLDAARAMLRDGIPLNKVAEYQKLTEEQVAKL